MKEGGGEEGGGLGVSYEVSVCVVESVHNTRLAFVDQGHGLWTHLLDQTMVTAPSS